METISEAQEEIVQEFSMFDDWMQRYEYMIELGKSLPMIDSPVSYTHLTLPTTPYV